MQLYHNYINKKEGESPSTIKYSMNNSRAQQQHYYHQNALLQLLQLQQYRELCYQMYLVGLALSEYDASIRLSL